MAPRITSARFQLMQRDKGRDQADAESGKESPGEEQGERRGGRLENHAEIEDPARCNQRPPTTDGITE